jgi:hypothetical protein
MTHNPHTSVQIEDTGIVRIFFMDDDHEIVAEYTYDNLDMIVGNGNAFGLAYQYLVSLNTRGYAGTIEAFGLQDNPGGMFEELGDDLTVQDILDAGE